MKRNSMAMIAAGVLVAACAATIAFSSNDLNTVTKGTADGSYSLTIDSPLYTGSGTSGEGYTYVQTAGGSNVKIKYSGLSPYQGYNGSQSNGINTLDNNSYIEVVSNEDIKGIAGLTSISIKAIGKHGFVDVNVNYGWDEGHMMNYVAQAVTYQEMRVYTYELPDGPSYVKIDTRPYSGSYILGLAEITFNYTCTTTVDPYVVDDYVLNLVDDDHFEVKRYRGTDTTLNIPSSYGDLPITAIADNFAVDMGMNKINYVNLPSSIKGIGYRAFFNATNLLTINLDYVEAIGQGAFLNCEKLGNGGTIDVYASQIGQSAFGSSGVRHMNFHSATGEIRVAGALFWTCTGLYTVSFDPDLTLITDDQMFARCSNLSTVRLPKTIKDTINRYNIQIFMFEDCSSLTYIEYPGTADEWNALSKENNWNSDLPATAKVHCSDYTVDVH